MLARKPCSAMSKQVVALSVVLLAAAWLSDMFTPQQLVTATLLAVPVAVASLYLERSAAIGFIVAALVADAIAGWFNGVREGGHFDPTAIGNRILVGLTIVLVGLLGTKARAAAQESGRLAARQALFAELARKNEELVRANASLAERGRVIRDLVYALSHDLRTPLAAAAMTLRQALDGKYGALPPEYQEILSRSLESNDEVRRLAETLLLVARYESGEQSNTRRPVALDRLVRSVAAELEPLSSAKRIEVRVDAGENARALGDESDLRRAIVNLLANAIKATPHDGAIDLKVSRNGRTVSVAVEDTGYGIDDEQRALLFERIPAGDTAPRGAGSGLGLYIVRRIAEHHGGSVSFQPREPNGSAFTIDLPAARSETSDAG
jgi:signal transduction histidine kinase